MRNEKPLFARTLRPAAVAVMGVMALTGCAEEPAERVVVRAPSVSSQSAEQRIERWTRERPGQPLQAAIAFHQLQPDSVIIQLLQRYRVQPYVAHVWAGGVSTYAQLPPTEANVAVIANARAQLTQRLERSVCNVAPRIQRMLSDRAAVRESDTMRIRSGRSMLARLQAETAALREVRAGGAVMWAVYVTGAPEDVRALGADSLVWGFEPIEVAVEEGQTLVGVPRPPEPKPVGELPASAEIEALHPDSVSARLQTFAARPATSCPPARESESLTGHWTVVARRDGYALLMPQPQARGRSRDGGADTPPAATDAMIFRADEPLQSTSVRLAPLSLPGVPAERARPLHVARVRLGARDIFVSVPGHAPPLHASPVAADTIVFAEANALWLLPPDGAVRRLTAERISAFDYASLSQKQREGEVILYWADSPVWSPDGRYIAYITNREAVLMNRPGQAIWLLDTRSGDERSLLSEPGDSYYPHGWYGGELLFGGSTPGIGAIDVSSGTRRRLDSNTFVAANAAGTTVVTVDNAPQVTRMKVLLRADTVDVAAPMRGSVWTAQAVFSPNGQKLLLLATSSDGRARTYYVLDIAGHTLQPIEAPSLQPIDWPQWLDDDTLLINSLDADTRAPRAVIMPLAH